MKFLYLLERLRFKEIRDIEKKLNKLYNDIGVDIDFSDHFKQRIIKRNIEEKEIIDIFSKLYTKYRNKLNKDEYKALIFDIVSYLNVPIKIEYNENKDMFILTSTTVVKSDKPINPTTRNQELLKV